METPPTDSPAGWFPDPNGRFELRWYNGTRWTADVSNDGHRFLDPDFDAGSAVARPRPAPTDAWGRPIDPDPVGSGSASPRRPAAAWGTVPPKPPKPPNNAMAILAFVFGLGSVVLGWAPFVFIIAAAGAIAALVLGPLAIRRARDRQGRGRGLAIAGVVLAPIGLALCVVGFFLTRNTIDAFDEFTEVGDYTWDVGGCSVETGTATVDGTIANLSDRERDYRMTFDFDDGSGALIERRTVIVEHVFPGESAPVSVGAFVGNDVTGLACNLIDVTGPYPFGLNPGN